MHVFLGGTVGTNTWRETVISALATNGIDPAVCFNPVVPEWNEAAQQREDHVKATADYLVFYIGHPGTPGNEVSAYSLVEVVLALVDDWEHGTQRTVAVFDPTGMSPHVTKAMKKIVHDLEARFPHATILGSTGELIEWLTQRLAPRVCDHEGHARGQTERMVVTLPSV